MTFVYVKAKCDSCGAIVAGWWEVAGKILCANCYLALGKEEL